MQIKDFMGKLKELWDQNADEEGNCRSGCQVPVAGGGEAVKT